jgi:pyruvate ferredoxin oxidoreductase beta subunit
MPAIMEAHGVSYIATASSSYPMDLYEKIRKARYRTGTRYLHVYTPCPPGWLFPTADTVRIGRIAIETGLAVLFEIEDGVFRLTGKSKDIAEQGELDPVEDCIALQGRFAGMDEAGIEELQQLVDARWKTYCNRAGGA